MNGNLTLKMKSVFVILFLVNFTSLMYAQSVQNGTIIVEITGIEDKGGVMTIGLFKETDEFLEIPSFGDEISIKDESTISVKLENIPFGTYAISIFHDLNENGELDSNFMGIPKEPIGFSNNHFPQFGPPKFKKAAFQLDKSELNMTINMSTY